MYGRRLRDLPNILSDLPDHAGGKFFGGDFIALTVGLLSSAHNSDHYHAHYIIFHFHIRRNDDNYHDYHNTP